MRVETTGALSELESDRTFAKRNEANVNLGKIEILKGNTFGDNETKPMSIWAKSRATPRGVPVQRNEANVSMGKIEILNGTTNRETKRSQCQSR